VFAACFKADAILTVTSIKAFFSVRLSESNYAYFKTAYRY